MWGGPRSLEGSGQEEPHNGGGGWVLLSKHKNHNYPGDKSL